MIDWDGLTGKDSLDKKKDTLWRQQQEKSTFKNKAELYRLIWNIVEGLRGHRDSSEFKNYILGFLFYQYISQDFQKYINTRPGISEGYRYEWERDDAEWIEDMKEIIIQEKGYFIYPQDLFINVLARENQKPEDYQCKTLGEDLFHIFNRIEESTKQSTAKKNFDGLFKLINLESNILGDNTLQNNRKIKEIMEATLQIRNHWGQLDNPSNHMDIFGDAYEFLIEMYADKAGKAGGEFYTPSEVSKLLVQLILTHKKLDDIQTVYDPTCGSGSLLLKFGNDKDITFYGQEINFTTYNICRINMFLHGVEYHKFHIACGDTLKDDKFGEHNFDVIVSNPPFGIKWEGTDNSEFQNDSRFEGPGILAPKNKADFAFILHSLYHLSENGMAAIICFPGILFRDKAEKEIRKYLIKNNYVDAVIQIAENLFFGTSITTCILILKKDRNTDDKVFFINAKNLFVKAKIRNKLDDAHIKEIAETYQRRQDKEGFARAVTREEIQQKEWSLSMDEYVFEKKVKEIIDIEQLNKEAKKLNEEVCKLNKYIDDLVKKF